MNGREQVWLKTSRSIYSLSLAVKTTKIFENWMTRRVFSVFEAFRRF
jgi:hypothetical protein